MFNINSEIPNCLQNKKKFWNVGAASFRFGQTAHPRTPDAHPRIPSDRGPRAVSLLSGLPRVRPFQIIFFVKSIKKNNLGVVNCIS